MGGVDDAVATMEQQKYPSMTSIRSLAKQELQAEEKSQQVRKEKGPREELGPTVTVEMLDGTFQQLNAQTVHDAKKEISRTQGIPICRQKFFAHDDEGELCNDHRLSDQKKGSRLYLVQSSQIPDLELPNHFRIECTKSTRHRSSMTTQIFCAEVNCPENKVRISLVRKNDTDTIRLDGMKETLEYDDQHWMSGTTTSEQPYPKFDLPALLANWKELVQPEVMKNQEGDQDGELKVAFRKRVELSFGRSTIYVHGLVFDSNSKLKALVMHTASVEFKSKASEAEIWADAGYRCDITALHDMGTGGAGGK